MWHDLRLPWLKYETGQAVEVAFATSKKNLLKVKFNGPELASTNDDDDYHQMTLTKFIGTVVLTNVQTENTHKLWAIMHNFRFGGVAVIDVFSRLD